MPPATPRSEDLLRRRQRMADQIDDVGAEPQAILGIRASSGPATRPTALPAAEIWATTWSPVSILTRVRPSAASRLDGSIGSEKSTRIWLSGSTSVAPCAG